MAAIQIYIRRLQRSIGAVYALLENSKAARRAVVGLLAVHSMLLMYSAYVHSPTLNEPGHLVAGLSIWTFGRFDVYSVNPPLVKMVAALPVMAAGYEEDWSGFYSGPGARPEFAMGEDFMAANGERSFFLLMIARWACIPFSWVGGVACYLWARDLYGRPAGVVACSIWCFEPNILAHASLITPDAHATALGLAACYTFWRWLKRPTWTQAALTGVVLGLAELAKTTLILFYPLWPLMWIIYRLAERRNVAISLREMSSDKRPPAVREAYTARDWFREAGMLVARMAVGLYVLNLAYGFEGSLTPLREYHFVSDLFTGQHAASATDASRSDSDVQHLPPSKGGARGGISPAEDYPASSNQHHASSVNRFAGTWLGALPIPSPKHYLIGIDLQQRDFEHFVRPSYLRGNWRNKGWWYYYLYAAIIKVPLGLWGLTVLGLIANTPTTANRRWTMANSPRNHFILLLPPLIVFLVVSSKTGFNEHFRYVLPCFPFFFVAISGHSKVFLDITNRLTIECGTSQRRSRHIIIACCTLISLLWCFQSSMWIYPHSLSYFNESIGGPLRGSMHLLGSNVDWGQDLFYALRARNEGIHCTCPVGSQSLYDPKAVTGSNCFRADARFCALAISRRQFPPPISEKADSSLILSANAYYLISEGLDRLSAKGGIEHGWNLGSPPCYSFVHIAFQ